MLIVLGLMVFTGVWGSLSGDSAIRVAFRVLIMLAISVLSFTSGYLSSKNIQVKGSLRG